MLTESSRFWHAADKALQIATPVARWVALAFELGERGGREMKRSRFFIQSLGMGLVWCASAPVLAQWGGHEPPPRPEREAASPHRARPDDRRRPPPAQGEQPEAAPQWAPDQSAPPDKRARRLERERARDVTAEPPPREAGAERMPDREAFRRDIERARREIYDRPPRRQGDR